MNTNLPLHTATPDPNIPQRRASAPDSIVWVSASAGSGKTKVLTDRVLRLLLPDPQGRWFGTLPHKLLCITFTKAAAAEMAIRVNDRLGEWAVMGESDLAADLTKLTGETATPAMIEAARRLFATVLDCPGGLKIMTIHGFCQSILGRFPLEAGVNPDFTVLDDQQAQELLSQSLDRVLMDAQSGDRKDLAAAFRRLAVMLQLDDLAKNIRTVLQKPDQLEEFFSSTRTLEGIEGDLKEALGLLRSLDMPALQKEFVKKTPEADMRRVVSAFSRAGAKLQGYGASLQEWLDMPEERKQASIPVYGCGLLTKKNAPLSLFSFPEKEPELAALFSSEALRYLDYLDTGCILRQCSTTAALMMLAQAVWKIYEAEKQKLDGLDYNDLIRKTERLLKSTSGKWVHFKLDGGIDHILMDEAQDTNPYQWSILEHLSGEIFAGVGRDTQSPRSLFVVGDKKQSIFSFQGADPASFDRMNEFFSRKSAEAERNFEKVPLDISFRTSPPVLKVTDMVFASPELREQIGIDAAEALRHHSFREKEAGLVELWPLIVKPKKPKPDKWVLPFADQDNASQESLAEQIASQISFWLQKGEMLESQGRPLTAGDILILVRTRTPLVHELVRQFKRRGIPVSGIDRLTLGDQIAVQDMLALARFARLQADDFSLGCILKSPLVGWDDTALMSLAMGRPGTLWEALKASTHTDILSWLEGLIALAHSAAPFEFLEGILNTPCPADPAGTGWRAITARLGEDVIDPLEELLSLSLKLEPQGVRTLEDLILWQQKADIEIKREMEEAGSQIRIMTVHAAKGLEAPVVILPDTTSVATKKNTDRFLWPEQSGLQVPLWAGRSDDGCKSFEDARDLLLDEQHAESARLLYVALTRARDRLYVMGVQSATKSETWYSLIANAFDRLENVELLSNGRRRISALQAIPGKDRSREKTTRTPDRNPPSWLMHPPEDEAEKPRPLIPSRADDHDLDIHSPFDTKQPDRRLRGTITHRLFELLPDLPLERRRDAALHYIGRAGRSLSADVQRSILEETLNVLHDPVFEPVFGQGSLAEVPITGILPDGRLISGQIDRLVITPDEILIVDYKTNRPSPKSPDHVPEIYRAQLKAYRDTLAQIHPNSLIKCAILWTDQPLLMPVII